jgi:ABC-type Fe3+-citrate transport system substrate-binding protein
MVARTGLRTRMRVGLIGIVLVGLVSVAGCGRSSSSSATGSWTVPDLVDTRS